MEREKTSLKLILKQGAIPPHLLASVFPFASVFAMAIPMASLTRVVTITVAFFTSLFTSYRRKSLSLVWGSTPRIS